MGFLVIYRLNNTHFHHFIDYKENERFSDGVKLMPVEFIIDLQKNSMGSFLGIYLNVSLLSTFILII